MRGEPLALCEGREDPTERAALSQAGGGSVDQGRHVDARWQGAVIEPAGVSEPGPAKSIPNGQVRVASGTISKIRWPRYFSTGQADSKRPATSAE